MSLSLGTGPLGRNPAGAYNFDIDGAAPAHRIYFADFLPRVRAVVGGVTVLDTTRGKLLYESGIYPRFYAPLEDYDAAVLQRTGTVTNCPFKGDASYWSLSLNGSSRADAIWAYEAPIPEASWLSGYAALYADKVDQWWVEDEPVRALRDPFHRIDVLDTSRRVVIRIGDDVIADTDRAALLFETGLPPVAYVPRADLRVPVSPVEGKTTFCPYKGDASYWTVGGIESAAWSYDAPRPEATGIAGRVAFDPSKVSIAIS